MEYMTKEQALQVIEKALVSPCIKRTDNEDELCVGSIYLVGDDGIYLDGTSRYNVALWYDIILIEEFDDRELWEKWNTVYENTPSNITQSHSSEEIDFDFLINHLSEIKNLNKEQKGV